MEVKKPTLSPRFQRYVLADGFSRVMREFAANVVELQDARHAADYDPLQSLKRSDAVLAVRTARGAVDRFHRAQPNSRKMFLALLLFPPR